MRVFFAAKILLPVAAISLASCSGPSAGEVAVLDEAKEYFPENIFGGSKIKVLDIDSSLSEADEVALLKEAGYAESEYGGRIGYYFPYVDGKNEDNVNRVSMSRNLFSSINMEKKNASEETRILLFYAGGTLHKFEVSKTYRVGAAYLDGVIDSLRSDIGKDIVLSKQDVMSSKVGVKVRLPVEGRGTQSLLQITADSCVNQGGGSSRNKSYTERMWTDIGDDSAWSNRSKNELASMICSLVVTFETPQAMIGAKGKDSLHSSSLYALREKYVEAFGKPDCWIQDDGCVLKDDMDAMNAVRAKLDSKAPAS